MRQSFGAASKFGALTWLIKYLHICVWDHDVCCSLLLFPIAQTTPGGGRQVIKERERERETTTCILHVETWVVILLTHCVLYCCADLIMLTVIITCVVIAVVVDVVTMSFLLSVLVIIIIIITITFIVIFGVGCMLAIHSTSLPYTIIDILHNRFTIILKFILSVHDLVHWIKSRELHPLSLDQIQNNPWLQAQVLHAWLSGP